MNLRFERTLITNCSLRGGMVGLCAGALTGSFSQAVGFAVATTAAIYISAKSNQFAAEAEAPAATL